MRRQRCSNAVAVRTDHFDPCRQCALSAHMNSRESRALLHKCGIKIARTIKRRLGECRYQPANGGISCGLIEMCQHRPKRRLSSQRSGKNAVEHGQVGGGFQRSFRILDCRTLQRRQARLFAEQSESAHGQKRSRASCLECAAFWPSGRPVSMNRRSHFLVNTIIFVSPRCCEPDRSAARQAVRRNSFGARLWPNEAMSDVQLHHNRPICSHRPARCRTADRSVWAAAQFLSRALATVSHRSQCRRRARLRPTRQWRVGVPRTVSQTCQDISRLPS